MTSFPARIAQRSARIAQRSSTRATAVAEAARSSFTARAAAEGPLAPPAEFATFEEQKLNALRRRIRWTVCAHLHRDDPVHPDRLTAAIAEHLAAEIEALFDGHDAELLDTLDDLCYGSLAPGLRQASSALRTTLRLAWMRPRIADEAGLENEIRTRFARTPFFIELRIDAALALAV